MSILLAFQAWQIYPDLFVLGEEPKTVRFHDGLIPQSGMCTVGSTYLASSPKQDIRWSLVLSHLECYGPPVPVQSLPDESRLTMEQLQLIAYGSIMKLWCINYRHHYLAAKLIKELWDQITRGHAHDFRNGDFGSLRWFHCIVQAAVTILSAPSTEVDDHLHLVRTGSRRAEKFLSKEHFTGTPFFGLTNRFRLGTLSEKSDVEGGIYMLRKIAEDLHLKPEDAIIIYCHVLKQDHRLYKVYEFATVAEQLAESSKRNVNGEKVLRPKHGRWLCSDESVQLAREQLIANFISERVQLATRDGEICQTSSADRSQSNWKWNNPPSIYDALPQIPTRTRSAISFVEAPDTQICKSFTVIEGNTESFCSTLFRPVLGFHSMGLFARVNEIDEDEIEVLRERAATLLNETQNLDEARKQIRSTSICQQRLWDYFLGLAPSEFQPIAYQRRMDIPAIKLMSTSETLQKSLFLSLHALSKASQLYSNLDEARISFTTISYTLNRLSWLRESKLKDELSIERHPFKPDPQNLDIQRLSRTEAFACILYFETGSVNVPLKDLKSVFAVSVAESIYVASIVLSDPFSSATDSKLNVVQRIVGNIGRPGISLLVAPPNPRIRARTENYQVVRHALYDHERANKFKSTSLHLRFTGWSHPVGPIENRSIYSLVNLVESVISVKENDRWVADLDILVIDFNDLRILRTSDCANGARICNLNHTDDKEYDYVSIDSWDEFLDNPEDVGIFRAHGNWYARLAAVSILFQRGQGHSVGLFGPGSSCIGCLERLYEVEGTTLERYESHLPSICID